MAEDKKISDLQGNPSIDGSEKVVIEKGGVNYSNTFDEVKNYVVDNIPEGDNVESVTGQGVDNTDPQNPVVSFPNTDQVTETDTKKFVRYDSNTDTYELPSTNDGQTQNLGQETFVIAYNNNGSGATALDPKVFMSAGSKPTEEEYQEVIKVTASDLSEGKVFGINTTSLQVGEYGKLTTYGEVKGVNTSSWSVNDTLYVDSTTSGDLTNVRPEINAYVIGTVLKADPTDGIIFVQTISSTRQDDAEIKRNVGKAFFTGDNFPTDSSFYWVQIENEGTIPTVTEQVTVADDSTEGLSKNHWTGALPEETKIDAGLREGQIEIEVSNSGGNEKVFVELYLTDSVGDVLDSGRVSQPTGDLGVRPIFTLETDLLDLDGGDVFKEGLRGFNESDFIFSVGQGMLTHVVCQKIGTAGGDKTFTVYFGSDHSSYLEILTSINTEDVVNNDDTYFPNESTQYDINRKLKDEKLSFVYPYVSGTYPKNTQTVVGNWLSVSNKETSEYPVPTPSGDPFYVYDGTSPTNITSAKQVVIGNRYSLTQDGYLSAWRINTVVGNKYKIYSVEDPLGAAEINFQFEFTATTSGWTEFGGLPIVVQGGLVFDLVVIINEPDPTPITFNGNWDYQTTNTTPISGQITHPNNNRGGISVSKTDNNTNDRSSDLAGLTVGDIIDASSVSWSIQSVTDQGTYIDFGVAPQTQNSTTGVQNFVFNTVATSLITYVEDVDYWNTEPNVQGFISSTGYNDIVLNQNAYGIDIQVQTAKIPVDWDSFLMSGDSSSVGQDKEVSSFRTELLGFTIDSNSNKVWFDCNFATDENIVIENESLEIGQAMFFEKVGSGLVNLVGGSGVTIESDDDYNIKSLLKKADNLFKVV